MEDRKLAIVWLSVDKQAAIDMALLYARDCIINSWFDKVELILWGPSVQSAAESEAVQQELAILQSLDIPINVCLACALRYGVSRKLVSLGYNVCGMGEHLSSLLCASQPVLVI